jgi:Trypsin
MPLGLPAVMLLELLFEPALPAQRLVGAGATQEIEGGRPTEPDEHESVVALLAHQRPCSGVMVSSTVLLTAAHCVADVGFGRQITMYYGPTVDETRRHQAAEWAAHPSYCPDCRDDWFDVGYVVLTLPFELEGDDGRYAVPVVTQGEWDELMREDQPLQVVGYGHGSVPRTKRVAEMRLAEVTGSGRELQAEPSNGAACDGDSGGAVFAMGKDGELRLVGINSRSVGCPGTLTATTPYPVLCWLRDETGVDLLPASTSDCSTLEIERGGCRVAGDGRPGLMLVGWGLLMVCARRRGWRGVRVGDPKG